jgi:type II secretory pathway pseudopilin PulG
MPGSTRSRKPSRAGGFTYATLLVLVTIMGIMAGVAQEMTWRAARAERETELMFNGEAYVHAIESYRLANGRYPRELQDLVRDPSSASRRHLRALYPDPFAKDKAGWHLIQAADGGIQGVASSSEQEPLKKGNFPKRWKDFEQAKTYRDWVFMYVPRTTAIGNPLPPATTPTPTVTPSPAPPPIATTTPTQSPGVTPTPPPTSP